MDNRANEEIIGLSRHLCSIPFSTLAESTQQLTEFLSPSRTLSGEVRGALDRLKHAPSCRLYGGLHFTMYIFHDIDIAFFNSRLHGNVDIYWSSTNAIQGMMRVRLVNSPFGITLYRGRGRCTVYLNADTIFRDIYAPQKIWQTMFHELTVAIRTKLYPMNMKIANTKISMPMNS